MRVSDVILNVDRTLRDILAALANRLSFADNMQCALLDVLDTGTADTEFIVPHNLGQVPVWYLANASAGYVYDGDRTLWTDQEIVLKCSASNASLKLVVF